MSGFGTPEEAARAIALAGDARERERIGNALAASVRERHVGAGWVRYLAQLERDLPVNHAVRVLPEVPPVAPNLAAFWGTFATRSWPADPFGVAFRLAMERGLRPRTDTLLVREVRAARRGRGRAAPSVGALHLCRALFSRLSPAAALRLYNRLLPLRPEGRIRRDLRILTHRAHE